MKGHYLSSGLALIVCLMVPMTGWGQGKETALREPLELARTLNELARDKALGDQRLERARRQGIKDRIAKPFAVSTAKVEAAKKETGGLKRFFQRLWTSKKVPSLSLEGRRSARVETLWQRVAPAPQRIDVTLEKRSVEEKKRLLKEGIGAASNGIASDHQIRSGEAKLDADQIVLLGSMQNALIADGLKEGLGFKGIKTDPQCPNIGLAKLRKDGRYEPSALTGYYNKVALKLQGSEAQQKVNSAEAMYTLAMMAEAQHCLSLRQLGEFEKQITHAMLKLRYGLCSAGKELAARAALDRYMPMAILWWDATKSTKVPETLRLLFLPAECPVIGESFNPADVKLVRSRDDSLKVIVGGRHLETLPPRTLENADKYRAIYARIRSGESPAPEKSPLVSALLNNENNTLQWLGVPSVDTSADGWPLTMEDLSVRSLPEFLLNFRSLGEGTCSLKRSYELATKNLTCPDQTSCRVLEGLAGGAADTKTGGLEASLMSPSRQPGGMNERTHFGVPRSCEGTDSPAASLAPSSRADIACGLSTSGGKGCAESLQNRTANLGCGFNPAMQGGGGSRVMSREDWRGIQADDALRELYERYGPLATERSNDEPNEPSPNEVIREELGTDDELRANDLYREGARSYARDYESGRVQVPAGQTLTQAMDQAARERAVIIARKEEEAAQQEGEGDAEEESTEEPAGSQLCDPTVGGTCTDNCVQGDLCLGADQEEPELPDPWGGATPGANPGEAPTAVIGRLSACAHAGPDLSADRCLNVTCDTGDRCCGGVDGGGSRALANPSAPGPGADPGEDPRTAIPVGPSIGPSLGGPENRLPSIENPDAP